jgi:CSLREA domain-containing protein
MDHACRRRRVTVAFLILLGSLGVAGALANTITVNSVADVVANDGQCTLREAIVAANTNAASGGAGGECAAGDPFAMDTIAFDISGGGVHTIKPLSLLPPITETVLIDGYTQPGSSMNTNPFPGALNTVLKIELDNTNSQLRFDGPACIVRGLAINRGTPNIVINADDIVVTGNFIGTDPTGTIARPGGAFGYGVVIVGVRHRADIGYGGGVAANERNLISGNMLGGVLGTAGTSPSGAPDGVVLGNFIGTDVTGTRALGFSGSIGMAVANAVVNSNLVSGNRRGGIDVMAPGNSVIQGLCGVANSSNLIGVQSDGVTPLPNGGSGGSGFGGVIFHGGNSVLGGGPCTGEGNVIAYNTGMGVTVVPGVAGVRITQNSIHHNTTGGISLTGTTTPLANDPCDADTAPGNHGQNYPVLTSVNVSSGSATAIGTIEGKANTDYAIELFSSATCSASGYGEGAAFIGRTSVTTDATCTTNFVIFSSAVPPGHTVFTVLASDTSTDPAHWDTSEFSACYPPSIPGTSFYSVTPCRVADTRNAPGPYGGPALAAKTDRSFVVGGVCGISATAKAVSFNFTITAPTNPGDLRVFPAGGGLPLVSTLNWSAGQTRANNAIIALGSSADLTVHPDQAAGTAHLIIDVNGYFQ